jgi:carbamoyl-phosphate synthase large subunit
VALSPLPALRLCRDKLALLNHLGAFTPVPETVLLTMDVPSETLAYPRFAKPRVGAGSRDAARVATPADLERLPRDGSLLLQEFLPGEEYSVDVYVRGDGAVAAAVPRVRMKTDSGIAVTARTVNLPDVIDAAVIAARESGVRYAVNVQFRRDAEGVCKLLEINPRFPGTLPLTTHAGVDIPAMMVEEMSGGAVADGLAQFREVMVTRYWTEQYFDADEWRALCPP